LCLGYRAARVVLWSTSAGMKGGASGVFLDAVPHRRDELCGPNHLTWLNGGFGGLTGAQPSTHTHLGSNSWGGGSGLGVLGVRFNPRSVETVGDAAERMPFGVPPSSFGGGEFAEWGVDVLGLHDGGSDGGGVRGADRQGGCLSLAPLWSRSGAQPSTLEVLSIQCKWSSWRGCVITIAAAAAAREARTRQERRAEEGRADGSVVEGIGRFNLIQGHTEKIENRAQSDQEEAQTDRQKCRWGNR